VKEPTRLRYDPNTPVGMRQALFTLGASPPLPPAVRGAMSSLALQLTSTTALGSVGLGIRWTSLFVKAMGANAVSKLIVAAVCFGAAGGVAYVAEPLIIKTPKGSRPLPRPGLPVVVPGVEPTRASPAETRQASEVPTGVEGRPGIAAPFKAEPTLAGSSKLIEQPSSGIAAAPESARSVMHREQVNPVGATLRERAGSNPATASPIAAEEALLERPSDTRVTEPGIASEAKLLERARSHVASDPGLALKETDWHRERFGEGHMSAERELIAVEALLRLGRRSEAENRAAPRLRLDPTGLYAKRLRQLLTEY
jgi:hypothetical protein